ncbi:uncharacterized protein LOC144110948 [Amblyomma americanum]
MEKEATCSNDSSAEGLAVTVKRERTYSTSSSDYIAQGRPSCRRGRKRKASGGGRIGQRRARTCESEKQNPETSDSDAVKEETDALSNAYVSRIMPDMSTIVQAANDVPSCDGHQHRCGEPSTKKGRRGAALQSTVRLRKKPSIEDTCTVDRAPSGPLGELLPAGTCLRRPSGFLVQHIANVIHNSPRRMLRTSHIYEALRNKFPFYRFMDKDGQDTWKSSVRHALFQRWFIKVPSSNARNSFWSLNYSERPRDWTMLEKEEQGQPLETKQALTFARHLGLVPCPARIPPDLEPPKDIRMSSVPTAGASQLPIVSSQNHEETSTNSPPRVLLAWSTQATPKSSPSGFNPLLTTPQYRDTGASCSAAARAEPTPVGMCTGLKETPTVNYPGPLPVQLTTYPECFAKVVNVLVLLVRCNIENQGGAFRRV